jgi:hypothetical protein
MAPNTTGVLRTKIAGMKIGDYIVCNYAATSNLLGTFSNLGGVLGTEIPLQGSATPSGSFYLIKVDKGMLIADRVLQHSITWDSLNNTKAIQGLPWDVKNLVPIMTSNTAPSGIASASSIYTVDYDAWKAFRGVLDTSASNYCWNTAVNNTTGWLAYEFTSPTIITGYAITPQNGNIIRAPRKWVFEGWDGTSWVALDSRNISDWVLNTQKSFYFKNNTAYIKYRINVSQNNGDASYLTIGVMKMYDSVGVLIRTLSGGVAYATTEGYYATTDASNGAFPVSNEWDQYITKFPTFKLPSGTLNDLFHWDVAGTGVYSWTQDTPALALGSSDKRVIRPFGNGLTVPKTWSTSLYSTVATNIGFRPVFQYRE